MGVELDRIPIKVGAVASRPRKVPVVAILTLMVAVAGVWVTYTADKRAKREAVCEQFVVEGRSFWEEYVKFTQSALARGRIQDDKITRALTEFQPSLQVRHKAIKEAGNKAEFSFNSEELVEVRKFVKAVDEAKSYAWTATSVAPKSWDTKTWTYFTDIQNSGRQRTGKSFTHEIDAFCVPK